MLKKAIISSGKSETYAKCMVKNLKLVGTTSEVTDLRNIVQPEQMLERLQDRFRLADFLCSGGVLVILGVVLVLLSCCACVGSCCKSSRSRNPLIIQIPAGQAVPYERMDKV